MLLIVIYLIYGAAFFATAVLLSVQAFGPPRMALEPPPPSNAVAGSRVRGRPPCNDRDVTG